MGYLSFLKKSTKLPVDVSRDDPLPVTLPGQLVTLLAETTYTTNGTANSTPVTELDRYAQMALLLVVAAKTLTTGTVDVYVQYSPDGGTTWDDLGHYTQIASGAVANGSYVIRRNALGGFSESTHRAATDGTLAANTWRDISWCDRLRIKVVRATMAGGDTVTLTLKAFVQ